MTPYDAILFDFDGVIADTEPLHCACWAEALRPSGIALDWNAYLAAGIGCTDLELLDFLGRRAKPPIPARRLWERYPAKQELFRARVAATPPISPATLAFLRSLTGYELALVTSTGRAEIEPVLERAGIRDCFAAAVYAEDVTHHKPHPEPYLVAAGRLGANHPLVVEDSEPGCASGRAAGFDVLRIADAARMPDLVRTALGAGKPLADVS